MGIRHTVHLPADVPDIRCELSHSGQVARLSCTPQVHHYVEHGGDGLLVCEDDELVSLEGTKRRDK